MIDVDNATKAPDIQAIGVTLLRCTPSSSRRVQVVLAVDVPPGMAQATAAALATSLTPERLGAMLRGPALAPHGSLDAPFTPEAGFDANGSEAT